VNFWECVGRIAEPVGAEEVDLVQVSVPIPDQRELGSPVDWHSFAIRAQGTGQVGHRLADGDAALEVG
jgi:hypothetical protein